MRTTAASLTTATKIVRRHVRELRRDAKSDAELLHLKLHVQWIEAVLIAAEAQLAALKSLKAAEKRNGRGA